MHVKRTFDVVGFATHVRCACVCGSVRRDGVFYSISCSQFIPDSSRIFRPTGKQIFIRYQSSVSLSRSRISLPHCRIVGAGEGTSGRTKRDERKRDEEVELSDKPRAITRRQRRRADIYGLRAWRIYFALLRARVRRVPTCARARESHTDPWRSPPLSLSLFPFLPTLAKERISRGVMRRRPSLDILPSSLAVRPSFLPSFFRHLGKGPEASSGETRSYRRVLPP